MVILLIQFILSYFLILIFCELVSLNQSDSFYYYTEFNIIPEYAKGYLGRDTITFGPESIELDQFNSILFLYKLSIFVGLNVNIENFIGADGQLTFTFK